MPVQMIPILIGITIVSFVLIRLVPGDPALQLLGNHYTPQAAAQVDHGLGLDRSLPVQYLLFLRHSVSGDLGTSYYFHDPVGHEIATRLPATLFLIAFAGLLTVLIAIPIGTMSALRQGRLVDQGARIFFLVGYALPGFLIGVLLILFFGVQIPIFPITGYGDGLASHVGHLFLPASHDLSVITQVCDRIAVMYAGQVVELADVGDALRSPKHPYTAALLKLRVGVVGTGRWAVRSHLPGWQREPRCEVVAIADTNSAALRAAGEQFGVTRTST